MEITIICRRDICQVEQNMAMSSHMKDTVLNTNMGSNMASNTGTNTSTQKNTLFHIMTTFT